MSEKGRNMANEAQRREQKDGETIRIGTEKKYTKVVQECDPNFW